METIKRFYGFSLAFTLVCLGLGAWYGLEQVNGYMGVSINK